MKKKLVYVTLAVLGLGTLPSPQLGNFREARVYAQEVTASYAKGDDYPWKTAAIPYLVVDSWGLYARECTSFTAYRLSSVNGFTLPRAYGNAGEWGSRAQREGYVVNQVPSIGSVAWWASGEYGHVAWVSGVYGNQVEIEEYNVNPKHGYSKRLIDKAAVSGYIHFKDMATSGVASSSLARSGLYVFGRQMAIKGTASLSSPDLAYYQAGESVQYDQVLEAENYRWISYLAYSGARRYIAIEPLRTSPTGTLSIQNQNDGAGTFDIVISDVFSPLGIKEVQVPVWSDQGGQDDIVWYRASRQANGDYKVTVNSSNHKGNRGLYHVHLYYLQEDGRQVGIGTSQLTLGSQNLASQGVYYFTQPASIRNQASLSSAVVGSYGVGASVYYDRIVFAEGRQWLSYISYTGVRRYIAI